MKTIKISFANFWPDFEPADNIILTLLKKRYDVQVVDAKDADYVFFSIFGSPYQYCDYPQVRIMWSGENYVPDFNLIDYAISPYPVQFLDRAVYFPMFAHHARFRSLHSKPRDYSLDILNDKPYFANFIASHESEYGIRGNFFKKLCEYKRVESPGTYLNNCPDIEHFYWFEDSKANFQRKCKFTLCFESTKSEGFITEKICDAFFADTIPVYYGSDTVKDIFNEKAFINAADYPDFDAVIEKIKEIDQDDEKYLEMLRQPIFAEKENPESYLQNLEDFLYNIFDQPYEKAYRRSKVHSPLRHEQFLNEARKSLHNQRRPLFIIKEFLLIIPRAIKRLISFFLRAFKKILRKIFRKK